MPRLLSAVAFLVLFAAASGGRANDNPDDDEFHFSQLPGFAAVRAARQNAPPPSAADRALLEQFKPVLHIPESAEGPLDFYRDYIARGELRDGRGNRFRNPDRQTLNRHRDNLRAVFVHEPDFSRFPTPVAYGGIRRATLILSETESRPVTFLSYHFVFRRSGLPAGTSPLLLALANLVADSRDWHQLDHYTACFIALDENEKPFAVLLQHHNHMRTYLVGDDPAFAANAPPSLDAAESSNELYPRRATRTEWPAAGFMSPRTVNYLAGIEKRPPLFRAAPDIAGGGRRIEYELKYLPPDDAFYIFVGKLGASRMLPGRDGPPGAIYNTLPSLHLPEDALPMFYWNPPDADYAKILRADDSLKTLSGPTATARKKLRARLARALSERGIFPNKNESR